VGGTGATAFALWIVLVYLFVRVLFPQVFAPVPTSLLFAVDSFAIAMLLTTGFLPLGYLLVAFYHLLYIPLYALSKLLELIFEPICVHTDLGLSAFCDIFVDWDKVWRKLERKAMKQSKNKR